MNKVKFAEYWNKLRPFCIIALTIYLIYCVFARKLVVDGYSMEPNFHDGDTLFVNTIAYISKEPNRFDVIALRSENRDYIKRIIGLPEKHYGSMKTVKYALTILLSMTLMQKNRFYPI